MSWGDLTKVFLNEKIIDSRRRLVSAKLYTRKDFNKIRKVFATFLSGCQAIFIKLLSTQFTVCYRC